MGSGDNGIEGSIGMRKQLQGIGLILFGIFVCAGEAKYLGVCIGIVGLARILGRGE